MTEQEAIKEIKGWTNILMSAGSKCALETAEAQEMAISALEDRKRKKPEKPNIYGDGYDDKGEIIYDMYDCPNCSKSYELDYEKYDFCPNCGQAIDWSEKG